MARYGRWAQAATARVNKDLFGTQALRFASDLPLQIGKLINTVGDEIDLTAEEIVRRHTLLPFFTALHEKPAYDRFSKLMIAGNQIHRSLKGGQTVTPWPDRLRYCPECDDQHRQDHGTPVWLRRHQLITSLICPEHGGILLDSEVDVSGGRELIYTAAALPRADGRAVAFPWSDSAMAQYRRITEFGHAMLYSQDQPDQWWQATNLRAVVRQKGFVIGKRIDMIGLIAEFDHEYADILQLWPRLQSYDGRKGLHWIYRLVGGYQFTTNPICQAILRTFLESRADGGGADAGRRLAHRSLPKPSRPELRSQAKAAENDDAIAEKVRTAAARLRSITPPVRITKIRLMRGVPNLYSLILQYPLPLTRAALAEETEDHAAFSPRRLKWIFDQASLRGEVVSLAKLLEKRMFKDNNLVRREWHRYYDKRQDDDQQPPAGDEVSAKRMNENAGEN